MAIVPLPARWITSVGHPAGMAVVFSVLGDSEQEAAAALARLCAALGLEVTGLPSEILGRGRWLGRARLASAETTTPPAEPPADQQATGGA